MKKKKFIHLRFEREDQKIFEEVTKLCSDNITSDGNKIELFEYKSDKRKIVLDIYYEKCDNIEEINNSVININELIEKVICSFNTNIIDNIKFGCF